jgi:hypothetical protein
MYMTITYNVFCMVTSVVVMKITVQDLIDWETLTFYYN